MYWFWHGTPTLSEKLSALKIARENGMDIVHYLAPSVRFPPVEVECSVFGSLFRSTQLEQRLKQIRKDYDI